MGRVYKAWHSGLHCYHALKMLPPERWQAKEKNDGKNRWNAPGVDIQ